MQGRHDLPQISTVWDTWNGEKNFQIKYGSHYDEDMARTKGKKPLEGLGGPMARPRTNKAKEPLQQVLTMLFEFRPKL